MSLTRWRQIKRVMKLCNNHTAIKNKGQEGYEPAYKFDYMMKTIVHNTNVLTREAELDLCGDETTWGFMGYGEAGTDLVSGIKGKPGVSRGGQIVLVSNASRPRP